MARKKLMLYVWQEFSPDWSGGLAFSIASSEEEAREMIIKDRGFSPGDWGDLSIHEVKEKCAFSVSGGS